MSVQLQDKVIAITGAAQGIGYATALVAASRGASVSIADIQAEALEKAKASIIEAHPSAKVLSFPLDVRDAGQVSAWIDATVAQFGRLDGAANIAGVIPPSLGSEKGLVENFDFDEWKRTIDINLVGVMHCMKYQLGVMKEGASLVNASSIAGSTGRAMNGMYTASKHGVLGLTRSAAKEVGPRGVRVNAICP